MASRALKIVVFEHLVILAASCKMAFFNKFGAILKQSNSVSSVMNVQSSMLNAIRCMSSKLFIGGFLFFKQLFCLMQYLKW